MKFLVLKSKNPYYNLAVEEYIFKTATESVFMLWQNEPTVVIGKNQNAFLEVDKDFIDKNSIKIARRITGGGAVYHDLGNVNYTYIEPNFHSELNFEYFTLPIIKALQNLKINCRLSGRNDLETLEGLKFSGSAQHRENDRVLHHGTLLFSCDFSVMKNALTPSREKLKSKAIKSVDKRVVNLDSLIDVPSVNDFIISIKSELKKSFNFEEIEAPKNAEIDRLFERNSSYNWIFGEKPLHMNYSKSFSKRFNFGSVTIEFFMSKDVIQKVNISGDFFENKNAEELQNLFVNVPYKNVIKVINSIDVGDYILGMKNEDLMSLIN